MIKTEIKKESVIKSKDGVLETYVGDDLLLFDSSEGKLYEINETGGTIWKLLDGKHLLKEIMLQLTKEYYDVKEVEKDLPKFLKPKTPNKPK